MGHGGEDGSGSEGEWEDEDDDEQYDCPIGCGEGCVLPLILSLESGNGEEAGAAGCLLEMVASEDYSFAPHMDELAQAIANAALGEGHTVMEDDARVLLLSMIPDLAEEAPQMLRSCALFATAVIPALVEACGQVDLDPAWCASDEPSDSTDDDTITSAASSALDMASISLGGGYILPIVAPFIQAGLAGADPAGKIGALMTITAIAEGAVKPLKSVLDDLVRAIVPCLLDEHPRVRHAAW